VGEGSIFQTKKNIGKDKGRQNSLATSGLVTRSTRVLKKGKKSPSGRETKRKKGGKGNERHNVVGVGEGGTVTWKE